MALVVTVTDPKTGEVLGSRTCPDNDYVLICDGACHVTHTQASANGTHVLTIKGRKGLGGESPGE